MNNTENIENPEERIPRPGAFYRDAKGRLYQIAATASHADTGEKMVVYQALYGDFPVMVKPLEAFVREMDRVGEQKTAQPDLQPSLGTKSDSSLRIDEEIQEESSGEEESGPDRHLMAFLDAEGLEERIACLREMKDSVSQGDLDSIYVVLDMKPGAGSLQEQLEEVIRRLALQQHYEGGRLR